MSRRRATILVVEDDRFMLEGISDLLTLGDVGYDVQVLMAENGRVALDLMAQQCPDLIISDIMMPELDGFELLNHVRQNSAWVHIPVVFITAKGAKKDIHKGRTSGANLYLTKPFNSSEVLDLVRTQLKRTFDRQASRQQSMAELKRSILQILNHEFRTPLTYVTAYYEMLAESLNHMHDEDNLQEFLRGIQAGCLRLARLVEDFIQVLELRTGETNQRFAANAQPIANLPQLIRQTIADVQANMPYQQLPIYYEDSAEPLPLIWGDAEALRQVFFRLLQNAVKFTHRRNRQEGSVTITTQVADGWLEIAFVDEGIGFPPHLKEQLFDLFFQYNRGLLEQQGSGIGLTIARALVQLHGGQIEAENRPDATGSVFTVRLPIYTPGAAPVSAAALPEGKRLAVVLVVEDDPFLLMGLQELLELFEGAYVLRVLTAKNGRAALSVLAQQKPDLIISDIMMPEMGGYEFLENVRRNPEWVHIPFIFLTARGEHSDIHRGLTSGAEEYITKPYDSEELLELVASQLDRYFMVQGAFRQSFEQLKQNILHLITPDFRLPLATVSKYTAHLVQEMTEAHTDEDLKQSLYGLREGSIRLSRLVEDLVTLAELETGEAEVAYSLRAQPVRDLGLYWYEAAQKYQSVAQQHGVVIHCPLVLEMPRVFTDGVSLQSGLQRLVELSLNYCIEAGYQGELQMNVAHTADEVSLSVHLPVALPAAAVAALQGEGGEATAVSPLLSPDIRILRGVVKLHNGRFELHTTPTSADMTIVLPTYQS